MSDEEANEFYADPENQRTAPGPAVRPPRPSLGGSIPARLPPATVEAIKRLADAEGLTVSAWVRRSVDQELSRCSGAGQQGTDIAE